VENSRDKKPTKRAKPVGPSFPLYSCHGSTSLCPNIRPIFIITDPKEANRRIPELKGPLGFDMEWRPQFIKGGPENPIALVQLSDRNQILLIHLVRMSGVVPNALKRVLENEYILKLGVGIKDDLRKAQRDLGVNLHGILELSSLARTVDASSWASHGPSPKSLISLARLAERYLSHTLKKSKKVQLANWEDDLNDSMIEYAANDAAVALSIYDAIKEICVNNVISIPMSTLITEIGPQASDFWKKQFV